MHRNDFVVSVQPITGDQAYREYKIDGFADNSDTRVRQINIPFNQEYQFIFKNMKSVRRSVAIEIDGSEIGIWVIDAGSKKRPYIVNLERFMDSDKRFKVLGLGDGGVDDPDNPNNGLVKITVIDEKTVQPKYFKEYDSIMRGSADLSYNVSGASVANGAPISYSADVSTKSRGRSGLRSSNVATGEGARSNQSFRSTYWNGDYGRPFYFEYRFRGVDKMVQKATCKPKSIFCVDCGVKLQKEANFCHACGAEAVIVV